MALSQDRKIRATVLQRYHFSSSLRRMSAIVRVEDEVGGVAFVCVCASYSSWDGFSQPCLRFDSKA